MVDGDVGLEEDLNKDVVEDDIQEDLFDELYRKAVGEVIPSPVTAIGWYDY